MSDAFQLGPFVANAGVSAVVVAAVMLTTFAIAKRAGRHSVVDSAWGAAFAAVAVATAVMSLGHGDTLRTTLICTLTAVWGLRLGVHIARRSHGQGEDPRYESLLSNAPGSRDAYALRMVYLLQGALVWVISMPVQVAGYAPDLVGRVVALGGVVWLVGFLFETIGDRQLARFKADAANRGRLMTTGLWSWTRHPNYFGDACVWWGIFIMAAASMHALLTVPAPVFLTWLLVKGSGKRLLENRMRERPGWDVYSARTSGFFPLPPGWKKTPRTPA